MTRSKLREHIFKALFSAQFHEAEELPEQIALYLKELEPIDEADSRYITEKTEQVAACIPAIDAALDKKATRWKTSRMGKVELTILRLAVYEIEQDDDVPKGVAIDQAVELAKTYGGEQSPAFVNGILAKFA